MRTYFYKNVYINNYYTVLGKSEYNPIIKKKVDRIIDSYDLNNKTYEISESLYQTLTLKGILAKTKKTEDDIDLLIGGDLQSQLLASNFNARHFNIPFLGVYSACSSFVEGLIISSNFIEGGFIDNSVVISSSHNLVNEKQFRFPVEYGYLRKKVNSYSSTGSVAAYLTNKKNQIKIESSTIGKVIDINHNDSNDMGSAMAPAAAEVLYDHLESTNRNNKYYDLILTGDLGLYGLEIMKKYLKEKYNLNVKNIMDAGTILFKEYSGKEFAGGSGPICLPLILFNKTITERYKKILIIGTGCLHSLMSVNVKETMPAISHAVSLEVSK